MKRHLWLISLAMAIAFGLSPIQAWAQNAPFVEGYVFLDGNRDGERQPEEPGILGVTVRLTPLAGPEPATAITDLLGYYLFEGLVPGTYRLEAQPPAGYECVRCQTQVEVTDTPAGPVNLALVLIVPWTPTPTSTPSNTPTSTPTEPPPPTDTPLHTDTPLPPPTHTPAPSPTPGNPVITFYVSPDTTGFPGDCTHLYWSVARATEVFLILPSGQIGVEGSGQYQVCPQQTTTYRLKVNSLAGGQEVVEARVTVPPPHTSTPVPPPRAKPTRQARPTATLIPVLTATALPTVTTPTRTPVPAWTPLPTTTPAVDPLLAGLPVRWGDVSLPLPVDADE